MDVPAWTAITMPVIPGSGGYGTTAAAAPLRSGSPGRKPEQHPATAPTPWTEDAPAPAPTPAVNRAQRTLLGVLAALHVARGVLLLTLPGLGLPLPGLVALPPPLSTARGGGAASLALLVSGLLGVRDVLLGGLLATADRRSDREVRRALAVNLLSDALDTFGLIFAAACWRRGHGSPVAEICLVAALAIVEHITLWTMSADHAGRRSRHGGFVGGYQARLQDGEDKKLRLEMWFADLRRDEEMRRSCSPAELAP